MTKLPVIIPAEVEQRLVLGDQALNVFHKNQLTEALSEGQDLRLVQEAHRLEWAHRRDLRVSRENAMKAKAAREGVPYIAEDGLRGPSEAPEAPVSLVSAVRTCRDCGVTLVPTGKRGKPAVRCSDCRDKTATIVAKPIANVCKDCSKSFPRTGKRGRQPSRCPKCQKKAIEVSLGNLNKKDNVNKKAKKA